MVNVAVMGSTGSIGTQVLNVISRNLDKFRAVTITASSNVALLKEQYRIFCPDYVGVYDEKAYVEAAAFVPKEKLIGGKEALTFACGLPQTDIVVAAVSGMVGLYTVEAAIKNNKKIALANKESLVAGGELINKLLKGHNCEIIPVDSEHSAIMQCLSAGRREDVKRLILTASGGPFYGRTKKEMENISPEQAVKHPTWRMGKKISIDSATMMNKALEIIEARYLFDINEIDYIIHPESIVHSMVEYCDGAVIAQLGLPNMEVPIQYALSIPQRLPINAEPLNLSKLTFKEPDEDAFPAPKLAKYCLNKRGDYCCRFNAANEACVSLFLQGKIKFTDIYDIVERVVLKNKGQSRVSVDELFECYHETVKEVNALVLQRQ